MARRARPGYHVSRQGQIIANRGRRNRPGPAGAEPSPAQTAATQSAVPQRFLNRLEGADLRLNPAGTAIRGGQGYATDEQRRLAQRAASRYGIMDNPFFDPSRAGFYKGTMYDLGTGSGLDRGGSENVLRDALLARLQQRVGYDPQAAYEQARTAATQPNGYVPEAYQSPEAYQAYQASARQNYLGGAQNVIGGQAGQRPPPGGTPPPPTDVVTLPDGTRVDPRYQMIQGQGTPAQVDPRSQMIQGQDRPAQVPSGQPPKVLTGPGAPAPVTAQGAAAPVSQVPGQAPAQSYEQQQAVKDAQAAAAPVSQVPGSPAQSYEQQGAQAIQGVQGLGLPLTGAYEQGMRGLQDQLARDLSQLGIAWDQIPAVVNLVTQRLGTQQGLQSQQLAEQANARGIYGSGIQQRDQGLLNAGFDRQRQDLAFDTAQQYQQLSNQMAEAYQGFDQELRELMLEIAQQQALDRPMTLPTSQVPSGTVAAGQGGDLAAQIAQITQRIQALREGGLTKRERARVRKLGGRRRELRGT